MSASERPAGDWGDHPVRRMPVARLRELLRRILVAAGCNEENARASAEGFVEADMRGVGRQGADHIGNLLEDLEAGIVNGSARPAVAREGPAFAVVDGAWATGHAGAFLATDTAVAKARDAGCAAVALTNGADIYMIGIYAGRIAEAGLVGMVFTASSSLVHPFGGVDRRLGTNPFAIGIPTGSGVPIVHDISTSAVSHSTVRQSAYLGLPLPEGVGVDRDGNPSTDAAAVLEGAIAPLAGHKGFGLGLCVALLAGPLTGGAVGRALAGWHDPGLPAHSRGHLFLAVDPAAFGEPADFLRAVDAYLDEIRSSGLAPGFDRIRIPGERSYATRRHSGREGITILEESWTRLLAHAERLGVEVPE